MTSAEQLIGIFGLIVGYFAVSKLIDLVEDKSPPNFKRKETKQESPSGDDQSQSQTTDESESEPWHVVLQVPPDATPAAVQLAYRKLMRQYHPDRVATLGVELQELAERKAKQINAAYEEAKKAGNF